MCMHEREAQKQWGTQQKPLCTTVDGVVWYSWMNCVLVYSFNLNWRDGVLMCNGVTGKFRAETLPVWFFFYISSSSE
jgi:hypothetical protein